MSERFATSWRLERAVTPTRLLGPSGASGGDGLASNAEPDDLTGVAPAAVPVVVRLPVKPDENHADSRLRLVGRLATESRSAGS